MWFCTKAPCVFCEIRPGFSKIIETNIRFQGFSITQEVNHRPRRGWCSIQFQSMWHLWWNKVELGDCSLQVLRFFPVYIIPQLLHFIFIYTLLLSERQTWADWELSKQQCPFCNQGALGREVLSHMTSNGWSRL